MNERGREIWLAGWGALLVAALAYFEVDNSGVTQGIIATLCGGTVIGRTLYKSKIVSINGNGGTK